MPDERFECPSCGALYKLVRVSADAQPAHQLIYCKACKHPLAPTHEGQILKYFLVRRPGAKRTTTIEAERKRG
jgi:hypothetical protein